MEDIEDQADKKSTDGSDKEVQVALSHPEPDIPRLYCHGNRAANASFVKHQTSIMWSGGTYNIVFRIVIANMLLNAEAMLNIRDVNQSPLTVDMMAESLGSLSPAEICKADATHGLPNVIERRRVKIGSPTTLAKKVATVVALSNRSAALFWS